MLLQSSGTRRAQRCKRRRTRSAEGGEWKPPMAEGTHDVAGTSRASLRYLPLSCRSLPHTPVSARFVVNSSSPVPFCTSIAGYLDAAAPARLGPRGGAARRAADADGDDAIRGAQRFTRPVRLPDAPVTTTAWGRLRRMLAMARRRAASVRGLAQGVHRQVHGRARPALADGCGAQRPCDPRQRSQPHRRAVELKQGRQFAEHNLNKWSELYVLIDLWTPSDCVNGNRSHCVYGGNVSDDGVAERSYDKMITGLRMQRGGNRFKHPDGSPRYLIFRTPRWRPPVFPDGHFDWIYLDATHLRRSQGRPRGMVPQGLCGWPRERP